MSYYILENKTPIKVSPKEFIEWNNEVEESLLLVRISKLKNHQIITKFFGYKQVSKKQVSFFETQLFIDKKFVLVLANTKTWDKSLIVHKKFAKIMRRCVKTNMDFLATIQGY